MKYLLTEIKTPVNALVYLGSVYEAPNPLNPIWLWDTSQGEKKLILLFYQMTRKQKGKKKRIVTASNKILSALLGVSETQIEKDIKRLREKKIIECVLTTKTINNRCISKRVIRLLKETLEDSFIASMGTNKAGGCYEVENEDDRYLYIPQKIKWEAIVENSKALRRNHNGDK